MTSLGDASRSFLEDFFGEGNGIRLEQYESSVPAAPIRIYLEPWLQRFERQMSPFVLPRVNPSSKRTSWYVLCKDAREARSMRESLLAFVGPTYSSFNGELATLDADDPIDRVCAKCFGPFVFRLPVIHKEDRAQVGELLTTLIEHRGRKPNRTLATVKPIGRLLRDLDMALLANNEQSAWGVYSEIRRRGRLSATNLAFLQVRVYGAFGRWTEILHLPNLNDLLKIRRPKRISEQIAIAVYRQHFFQYEATGDVVGAIDEYRRIGFRFQKLLRSTDGIKSPDAVKFALLSAVASDPPKHDRAAEITQHWQIASDVAWADALVARMHAVDDGSGENEAALRAAAEACYYANDFDGALTAYLQQPPRLLSVTRVLEIAVEVDTRSAATDALVYLAAAGDKTYDQVIRRRVCSKHIELLNQILGRDVGGNPQQIASLLEWFKFVDNGQAPERAGEVLEYGITDWISCATFDATAVAQELQKSRTGRKAEVIRNAVPIFIRAMLVDRAPRREYHSIYHALTDLVIYDQSVGADDLVAVEHLVEAILTTAPNHEAGNNDFEFATALTVHLWESIAAPRHVDWILSMLDLLIDTGAQQHVNLTPILASFVNTSRAWGRRISDDQWALLRLLACDLGLSDMIVGLQSESVESAAEDTPEIRGLLAGKSIAVYSITERIARRFGQLAEHAFDGIKIHYLHDTSLTDRMRSLAQSADIFIVNSWDAKHAATDGIKNYRNISLATIWSQSKSARSLFSSLVHYVVTHNFP